MNTTMVFVCFLLASNLGSSFGHGRSPCRYLIPEGYVGWVRIDYGVGRDPALPLENGFRKYKFPASGQLSTSSSFEAGSYSDLTSGKEDEFYYYSGDSRRRLPAGAHWADGGVIWRHTHVEGSGGEIEAVPGRPGSRDQMPGRTEGHSTVAESYEFFFVGSEDDYQKYGSGTIDRHGNPKIGPVKRPKQEN